MMADEPQKLREVIRARRKELGLSIAKFARIIECSDSYIEGVEAGRIVPSDKFVLRMAAALQLDADDLEAKAKFARENREPQAQHRSSKTHERVLPPPGRETILTPEMQTTIVEAYKLGNSLTAAANYAGIERHTLAHWLNIGETAPEGSAHHSLYTEVLKAKASVVIANSGRHGRWSRGGIIEKPKLKTIITESGAVIRTNEVELDKDGNPIMVKYWLDPDLRGIEWELTRYDPETYASPDSTRVTQINNQKMDVRPSLIAVLEQLGPIPDDDYNDYQAANKHKLNGGGNNRSGNGTGQ
jgi:transcriptional regulator with XRE-family HTH domain